MRATRRCSLKLILHSSFLLLILISAVGLESGCRVAVAQTEAATDASSEALERARKLVKELYADDFAKAKTTLAKEALIKKLMAAAAENQKEEASREALYEQAIGVAIEISSVKLGVQAALEQADDDDERAAESVLNLVTKITSNPKSTASVSQLGDAAIAVVPRAVKAERFDLVSRLAELVSSAATKSKEATAIRRASKLNEAATELAKLHSESDAAESALETDPMNTKAAAVVGKYRCFVLADWEAGLPLLAKGSEAIHQAAVKEVAGGKAALQAIAIADAWTDAATGLPDVFRAVVLKHADDAYAAAEPAVMGLEKTRLAKRREELAKSLKAIEVPVLLAAQVNVAKAPVIESAAMKLAPGKGSTGKPIEPAVWKAGKLPTGLANLQPAQIAIESAKYETTRGVFDLTDRMGKAARLGAVYLLLHSKTILPNEMAEQGVLKLKMRFNNNPFNETIREGSSWGVGPVYRPLTNDRLSVSYAFYGAGILGEPTFLDLTDHLNGLIKDNGLHVSAADAIAGINDPAPGATKILFMAYSYQQKANSMAIDPVSGLINIGKPGAEASSKPMPTTTPTTKKPPTPAATKAKLKMAADAGKIPIKKITPYATGKTPSVIEVLEATYGEGNNRVDLTSRVQASVAKSGYLVVAPMRQWWLSEDANYGPLTLRFKVDGVLHLEQVRPSSMIAIDGRKPIPKVGDESKILEAFYGGGILGEPTWFDVTDRVIGSMVDGKIMKDLKSLFDDVPLRPGPARLLVKYARSGDVHWASWDLDRAVTFGDPRDIPLVQPLPMMNHTNTGLELIDANVWYYGGNGLLGRPAYRDLTDKTKAGVDNGRLMFVVSKHLHSDFTNASNPIRFALRYRINGRLIEGDFDDDSIICIETKPTPEVAKQPGVQIVDARYGTGFLTDSTWANVKPHVDNIVQGRPYTNTVFEVMKGMADPLPTLFPKHLVVIYRQDGQLRLSGGIQNQGSIAVGTK